jgi:hypothetical protein
MDFVPLHLPFPVPARLRELFREYIREFGENASPSDRLHGEQAWEIRFDGVTAGYTWVQRINGELHRSTLIFPEFQQKGLWSEAQWHTEQFLAELGVETLYAQVNTHTPRTGQAARRALLGAGFSIVPDEIFGPGEGASVAAIIRHPAPVVFRKRIGLTAAEHARARELAYQYALARGDGELPLYDPTRAAEDFCRAAGEIIRQRSRRLANG